MSERDGAVPEPRVKRILCFGDSNTWGYTPGTGERYGAKTRWTGVSQQILGDRYCIVEAGLSGRTTVFDDPYDNYMNGAAALGYALLEASPVDLVVIMLGTNDLKHTNAVGSARGIGSLISSIRSITSRVPSACYLAGETNFADLQKTVEILVVSPIHVHPEITKLNPQTVFESEKRHEKSLEFADAFRRIAAAANACFFDAATVAKPSDIDGIHMMPEAHRALGEAIAEKIKEIFQDE
jgi:lysophospholipase L1-like esterase